MQPAEGSDLVDRQAACGHDQADGRGDRLAGVALQPFSVGLTGLVGLQRVISVLLDEAAHGGTRHVEGVGRRITAGREATDHSRLVGGLRPRRQSLLGSPATAIPRGEADQVGKGTVGLAIGGVRCGHGDRPDPLTLSAQHALLRAAPSLGRPGSDDQATVIVRAADRPIAIEIERQPELRPDPADGTGDRPLAHLEPIETLRRTP